MDKRIEISQPATGEEEWHALRESLETGWLTSGPRVAELERLFSERIEVRETIASTSCTTALHLILVALGVGPGDEVVVPAFTWITTANVVLYCGATPVFVDVDPVTFNMDPKLVAACVNERTKAVIAVHLFGLCADMDAIAAAAPGVPIIEDAACAVGARYRGRPAGGLARAGAFSLHPRKIMTSGEGGLVTTDDVQLAERLRSLRNHGASVSEEVRHHGPRPYLLPEFNLLGFNYRMTDLQGAVACVQLSKLDSLLEERRRWAAFYQDALSDVSWLRVPRAPEGYEHGWQAFVCFVDPELGPRPRNELMDQLLQAGVSTRPGTHAVHCLGLYRERFGFKPEDFPRAWDCDRQSLAIPLHNRMTSADYERVVAALRSL
ncbi:MAG: DegT/DnrJ/EryC1/StrS family aminotransferase [Planctomycetes bacterium]|nr:DegT/DnrJ/EryC1/StrS family aminotransferase [Planctomycetota bacterium]